MVQDRPMWLLISNRKLHTGFQVTYKSITLDDLEVSLCTIVMENWPYLKNGKRYGLGY